MKAIVHRKYGSPDILQLQEIDRRYKLSELPEAMRYPGTGHARGKLIIAVKI